jgi:carbonic anhydrase
MSTVSENESKHIDNADQGHDHDHDHGHDDFFKHLLESKNDIANGVVTEEQLVHYCKELGLETGPKNDMQVKILAAITDKLMSSLAQPKKLKLSQAFQQVNAEKTVDLTKLHGYEKLLANNKRWVADRLAEDPYFFERLSHIQIPKVLWIGCSDSRIPPTAVTGTRPGDIFEHRNVANLVIHTDMNFMTVLQYAVETLKVHDIIVCGHYNCGGVRHSLTHSYNGLINKWLRHIKDTYAKYCSELDPISDPVARERRLVELNVQEQVFRLVETSLIQKAWTKAKQKGEEQLPRIHGWVYDIHSGYCRDLQVPIDKIHPIYTLEFTDEL